MSTMTAFDALTKANSFIRQFKIIAIYHSWEEKDQLSHLELFLKGKALRIYKQTMSSQKAPTTMKPLYDALEKGCASSPARLLSMFHARRKLPGESFHQFAAPLSELLGKAMPDQYQHLLKSHFMDSVPDAARKMDIWNANIDVEMLVENLDQTFSQSKSNLTSQPAVLDQFKLEPISLNFMGGTARPTGQPSARPKFNGNCHHCNNYGHRISECNILASERCQNRFPAQHNLNSSILSSYSPISSSTRPYSGYPNNQSHASTQNDQSRQSLNVSFQNGRFSNIETTMTELQT